MTAQPDIDGLLFEALRALPAKPDEGTATAAQKKRYSELVSNAVAPAFGEELRRRGMREARPAAPGEKGLSGAERRMAGAIGAKRVDVTWATEESGLLLAISVKSINWRDGRSGNFQKNLTNRRGDLLYEAVTLHRRFPYAVLGGFLFLDKDAETDDTKARRSTFANAHHRLALFDGRDDPAGRDEQYERLYLVLLDANPFQPSWRVYRGGDTDAEVPMGQAFDELVGIVAQRNPDFYEAHNGTLRRSQ